MKSKAYLIGIGSAALLASLVCAQETPEKPVVTHGASARFAAAPGLPDCITMAVLKGNPSAGPSTIEMKIDNGCYVPWHWHTASESAIPLAGLLQVTMKGEKPVVLVNGDYGFLPSKHVHQAKCASSKPCVAIFELDAPIDIHYVDKAGEEIPAEKALADVNKSPAKPAAKP
jgi:quercetin dioxygenase-like cupin family protein